MRRRDFIRGIIGSAAAWPVSAHAQQPKHVVGFLGSTSAAEWIAFVEEFQKGMAESGYTEGVNVVVDCSGAQKVDFGPSAAISSFLTADLGAKRLGLLRELIGPIELAGMLFNPHNPNAESVRAEAEQAARALGMQVRIVHASTAQDIDAAFASLAEQRVAGVLVSADAFFLSRREQMVALAHRYAMPAIYFTREFVPAGGLMSYGTALGNAYRRAGLYTGKILGGARPAELPVEQSTTFELVINSKTAKSLGLDIPPTLLARADEVIE
jgi:putative tryptophan/tyrosine transport system substrate-binding protein